MSSLRDFVPNATTRQQAALEAALREGERIRWAVCSQRGQRIYVLTNHRAHVLARHLFFWKVESWPLSEQMVYCRLCRPGGAGDLLFAAGTTVGFTYLPNLLEAQRELNAAVYDLLDAAEQHLGNRAQNS